MTTIAAHCDEIRDMLRELDASTWVCSVDGPLIRLTLDEHEFVLHQTATEWSCEHRTPPCGPLGISRWTRCSGSWASMLALVRRVNDTEQQPDPVPATPEEMLEATIGVVERAVAGHMRVDHKRRHRCVVGDVEVGGGLMTGRAYVLARRRVPPNQYVELMLERDGDDWWERTTSRKIGGWEAAVRCLDRFARAGRPMSPLRVVAAELGLGPAHGRPTQELLEDLLDPAAEVTYDDDGTYRVCRGEEMLVVQQCDHSTWRWRMIRHISRRASVGGQGPWSELATWLKDWVNHG